MAVALAGGYVLGRTKKAKLAFALATFAAGRKMSLDPTELLSAGARQLAKNPQLEGLRGQISDELMTAVKTAAAATVDRRVSALSGSLRDRTEALSGAGDAAKGVGDLLGDGDEDAEAENENTEEDDEQRGEDEAEPDESEEEESGEQDSDEDEDEDAEERGAKDDKRRSTRERRSSRRADKAGSRPGGESAKKSAAKKAPAKKAPAKRAPSKKSDAPRRAGSGSSGGAEKAASGTRSRSGRQGR